MNKDKTEIDGAAMGVWVIILITAVAIGFLFGLVWFLDVTGLDWRSGFWAFIPVYLAGLAVLWWVVPAIRNWVVGVTK
jgi:hypothetical protein